MQDQRPFRPNVGICLFNRDGLVFCGRHFPNETGWPDPEVTAEGADWGLPQGGIDENEDIVAAARRELDEETGVTSVSLLAVTPVWWHYDFPRPPAPTHKLAPFRGQKQRYVIFRFEGEESEIRIDALHTAEPAEFAEWRWRDLGELPQIGLVHRRPNYRRLVKLWGAMNEVE